MKHLLAHGVKGKLTYDTLVNVAPVVAAREAVIEENATKQARALTEQLADKDRELARANQVTERFRQVAVTANAINDKLARELETKARQEIASEEETARKIAEEARRLQNEAARVQQHADTAKAGIDNLHQEARTRKVEVHETIKEVSTKK